MRECFAASQRALARAGRLSERSHRQAETMHSLTCSCADCTMNRFKMHFFMKSKSVLQKHDELHTQLEPQSSSGCDA